ncbi:hypothetical protein Ancab_036382 [Ancistrocladus abbreviatus]
MLRPVDWCFAFGHRGMVQCMVNYGVVTVIVFISTAIERSTWVDLELIPDDDVHGGIAGLNCERPVWGPPSPSDL